MAKKNESYLDPKEVKQAVLDYKKRKVDKMLTKVIPKIAEVLINSYTSWAVELFAQDISFKYEPGTNKADALEQCRAKCEDWITGILVNGLIRKTIEKNPDNYGAFLYVGVRNYFFLEYHKKFPVQHQIYDHLKKCLKKNNSFKTVNGNKYWPKNKKLPNNTDGPIDVNKITSNVYPYLQVDWRKFASAAENAALAEYGAKKRVRTDLHVKPKGWCKLAQKILDVSGRPLALEEIETVVRRLLLPVINEEYESYKQTPRTKNLKAAEQTEIDDAVDNIADPTSSIKDDFATPALEKLAQELVGSFGKKDQLCIYYILADLLRNKKFKAKKIAKRVRVSKSKVYQTRDVLFKRLKNICQQVIDPSDIGSLANLVMSYLHKLLKFRRKSGKKKRRILTLKRRTKP
jgi:hypothetical protein